MFTSDITARYNILESLAYEAFVAPAVFDLREEIKRDFLAHVPRDAHILDVGSGSGHLSQAIAEHRRDLRVTGVDILPRQVQRAQRKARDVAERVHFTVASALDLPFEDATFDALVSIASIKHWPDRPRGLRECLRVLRPGAPLLIVETDRGCTFEAAEGFIARWRIPRALRPMALMFFRTYVAGRSLDAEDAEALLATLEATIEEPALRRVQGFPGLMLTGRAGA